MKTLLLRFAALALCTAPMAAQAQAPQHPLPPDAVIVLAALHTLHPREDDFTYADLERLLESAAPDILVTETRPDELADRADTPGRPEYPAMVWPWLAARGTAVEAMEPGGETFARMTRAAGEKYSRFERERPTQAAETDRLKRAITLTLIDHWRHPADAHDQRTRDLVEAAALIEQALGGPGRDEGQREWDGFMIARVREIVAANPGKRIVVLASYRNQQAFREGLAGEPRLVDAEPWIRTVDFAD